MIIVNDETKSRIGEGGVRSSNIDLIFCSKDILQFTECTQLEDSWGSDHFPIKCEVRINRCIYKKKTNRLSKKKTDWKEYEKIILKMEDRIDEAEFQEASIERRYEIMVQNMIEAVEIATYSDRRDKKKKQEEVGKEMDEKTDRKKKIMIGKSNKRRNPVA